MAGEFETTNFEEIEGKNLSLIVGKGERMSLLTEAGYELDDEGYIIDQDSSERVEANNGEKIDIEEDKDFALIAGSHIFVKNVAGYSQVLTDKGEIKVESPERE